MKTVLKTIFINAIFLVLSVFILELIFGGWIKQDPMSGLNILKNTSFESDPSELYSWPEKIHYHRDAFGLRGLEKGLDQVDILTIGGSTTDQRYLDDNATWQEVFEDKLKHAGIDIDIVNAGVDGQSTRGNLKNFELWFPQLKNLKPDFVIVYTGINDAFSDDTSNYDDVAGNQTLKGIIKSKSAMYRLYQTARGVYQAKVRFPLSHRSIDFQTKEWTAAPLIPDKTQILKPRLDAYQDRLILIGNKIKAWGAKPIFITQTSRLFRDDENKILGIKDPLPYGEQQINGVDFYDILMAFNESTLKVCHEENGICLDLSSQVHFINEDFYDYFHNTPAGAMKIADYLFSQIGRSLEGSDLQP